MKNILFLYHDPCTDGYLCRIVAEFFYTHAKQDVRVEYVGVNPSSLTADLDRILSGKVYDEILMFDVSLTPQNYNQLSAKAPIVKVFDHHESTAKAFANVETNWLTFDNNHCGAYLAFRYFYGNETPVPKLIQYVEVRDIWLYEKPRDLPESKEITTFLYNDLFRMPFKESREYFFLLFDSTNDWWCGALAIPTTAPAFPERASIVWRLLLPMRDALPSSQTNGAPPIRPARNSCSVFTST